MCFDYGNGIVMHHQASREDLQANTAALNQAQTVFSSVGANINQAACNIVNAQTGIDQSLSELRAMNRKPRKKKGCAELGIGQDKFYLVQAYSDGTKDLIPFFTNVGNKFDACILKFPLEISEINLVQITFENSAPVIFARSKLTKEKLYQSFLMAGIHFNPNIPERVIKQELLKFFLPILDGLKVKMIYPIAGWNEENWYRTGLDLKKYWNLDIFPSVPVMYKIFPRILPEQKDYTEYYRLMKQPKDKSLRLWLMIYPFFSLISSLIGRWNCSFDVCLNIVTDDEGVRKEVVKRMSIFNRESTVVISLNGKKGDIETGLAQYGDEVIFASADMSEMRDYASEKKLQINTEYMVSILTHKRNLPAPYNRPVYSGGVIFSNYPIILKNVFTVYADKEDFGVFESGNFNVIGWIYQEFIKYVSKNFGRIKSLLERRQFSVADPQGMKSLLDIINDFWISRNINFIERMNEQSRDSVVDGMQCNSGFEDELDVFRNLIRKKITYVPLYNITEKFENSDNLCVYTKEFLIIPVVLVDSWLQSEKLSYIKKKVLTLLNNNGKMKTHEHYIYKFQADKARINTYCISLEFFNKVGEISIQKLGGTQC